ncbi:hypothetical protein [Geodermatophilus telluris]|uniref:hypothetical protein n=1 Tax=Geodermatophilus telluris TaxID=1190417 RepID=UPI00111346E1|nr:hypothetical protein [Geodermatophilus telluris]
MTTRPPSRWSVLPPRLVPGRAAPTAPDRSPSPGVPGPGGSVTLEPTRATDLPCADERLEETSRA